MALDLRDASFFGPALPEPFVKYQLEALLNKKQLLPKATGPEGRQVQERWEVYRRQLRLLGEQGGDRRVCNHVIEPLVERLGYESLSREEEVSTREGMEDGGWLLKQGESGLRAWSVAMGIDLDAPNRRGRAYRFSPSRVAQRVLLARGERLGLLTNGEELRLLLCDPARPDSHIAIRLDRAGGWRAARQLPDSYRLLLALAGPAGMQEIPALADEARLAQSTVTRKLRQQARSAVEDFIQEVLEHPHNAQARTGWGEVDEVARILWKEGLYLVYRLLFVFKLESSADPARAFSFAATSLWRNTYSPNTALAPIVRKVLDEGAESGQMLEGGLRTLFRLFVQGLSSSELKVNALGGMLFGEGSTPLLDSLHWGERAVAKLLDRLLWTPGDGKVERERVHYGALDVEDLGRVYEALLELEPGITAEPMCRLRRAKLEVVVSAVQGEAYRTSKVVGNEESEDEGGDDEEEEGSKKKTKVQWIEDIPAGRFFLRVGLGRKASGSYYTPHAFVRFLVQETLGPQINARSPTEDPQPAAILQLKVLDPAMGSGHFLVEACRYLGQALYEACRLCDERAMEAEEQAETAKGEGQRVVLVERAHALRQRVEDLPDPEDELVAYLPSRVPEGEESGLSQSKAEALCRRLAAVHCLYGVDKNPLAVELAKVSLWLESYAEGLPLTFLDHRLLCGDSLTGPFFAHLLTYPGNGEPLQNELLTQGIHERLSETLGKALDQVRDLEATVGKDLADLEQKQAAKARLDQALAPFKVLAAAWSGGVMLGEEADDLGYGALVGGVAGEGETGKLIAERPALERMAAVGREGVAYDLCFPEVFHPDGKIESKGGFNAVLGNPPWDTIRRADDQFFAGHDFRALVGATKSEKKAAQDMLLTDEVVLKAYRSYTAGFELQDRTADRLFEVHKARVKENLAGRGTYDAFMLIGERSCHLLCTGGLVGLVLPSAFHANEGSTGLRRLFLEKMALQCCYSFENRKKLFDIHASFKFAAVVARRDTAGTQDFSCAFYLHDLEWLFASNVSLQYSLEFVQKTGGDYLSFLELRSEKDRSVADACFATGQTFGAMLQKHSMKMSQEVNMTYDSRRFTSTTNILSPDEDPRDPTISRRLLAQGCLTLHEGKTFHQFDDCWGERPRYLVRLEDIADKSVWKEAARYYRLAFRAIARSTDERTAIFALVPGGAVFGHSAICERASEDRPNRQPLLLLGLLNSFSFDWGLRQKSGANVSLFILNGCPFPNLPPPALPFLTHAALRLTCNHAGYAPLWTEQVGDAWRESAPKHTWPVLAGEDARWQVRAQIDAVVAQAYGLDRAQYAHVLSSFSHKSYPQAPARCLAAFDELHAIGLEAFVKKHDPYWDIPLNENLPKPVIDLPGEKVPAADKKGQLSLLPPDYGPLFAQNAENRNER